MPPFHSRIHSGGGVFGGFGSVPGKKNNPEINNELRKKNNSEFKL
jgi:hypothetical protein